jgi:mannose-6-phosphate isomerase-like protein (cupin superfamily)
LRGQDRTIPGTDAITLKATGEETGSSIGFLGASSAPETASPRHIYHDRDELFYVLKGEFLFLVGERQVSAPPGTFVFIPRGTVHVVRLSGSSPAKCSRHTYRGFGAIL